MFIDDGQNLLATLGGKRYAAIPAPAAPTPVLAAAALATRPSSAAQFFGPGLAAGTYGYRFSLLIDDVETQAGPEATVAWAGPGVGEVAVTLPALPAGATALNLYGRTAAGEVLLARNVTGQLAAGAFVDQGQALDGQALVPANSTFKRGGGRVHRIHVPGAGGTPGNVKLIDTSDPTGASGVVLFGPTTPAAGSITDVQLPFKAGLLVQSPAGMTYLVSYS
ncbi:MAG TPA: hypothetical protein VFS62_14880 [Chloroflexota bacterium]|jgi:hypothetical protein|nr:hypothetical protein [Chloroflexota bacterium]